MSREEAIKWLKTFRGRYGMNELEDAVEMAIKALEQEPFMNKPCVLQKVCMANKNDVLAKIKAKLIEEKECAYADFERYKVEYLGQDWDDVCDTLPQDDFRYGMERCIDIINNYMAESEDEE